MKQLHGLNAEPGYHEKSLLDKAIDRYKVQAEKYYKQLNELENVPDDVRQKRTHELDKIRRYLDHQRMTCETMACVQAGLDKYRSEGREATKGKRSEQAVKQKALLAEGHHKKDLTLLEKMMLTAAKPRPSSQHSAHHIVPGKGKIKDAYLARVRMHIFGVRINDPDNGVWLPRHKANTPHWSMPNSKAHLEYHTEGYETWVRKQLDTCTTESQIRQKLNMIGKMLQQNNLPKEAGKKTR